jgi:hypothetical protein
MFHRITRIFYIALIAILVNASCNQQEAKKKKGPVTFAEDIAPIIHKNCTKCHVPEEAGPFNLITYEDVARRGKLIKFVVGERIMPPWPADPSYSHFANETVLTDEQIALIQRWVDDGMLPGDTSKLETPEQVKASLNLGKPDLILKVPTIPIRGNNKDLFLVVKVPYELAHDTFVRAIEFIPGSKKLVHHMNGHLVQFDALKKKNVYTGKSYVNQDQVNSQLIHKELGLLQDDGTYPTLTPSVSNYLPGALFSFYPKEIGGYTLAKKGALYLNDMHFGPSAIDAIDSSYFKIYFSNEKPKRPVSEFQMGTLGIAPVEPFLSIPPNEEKTFHIKATMPNDISLISIVPHMHLIGKSFWAYAVKESGDTIPLIRVNNWDFRWQYFYQFKKLLKIPRGTTIYVEGVYDNTAKNPNNPFNPPRLIEEKNGSMRTTDEMFQLIVTYVPYQPGDENISLEDAKP